MTGSDRHTIFVALRNSGDIASRIYLTPGDFQVCDGNAFDAAHSCDGSQVASTGAVFQLPCNTAVPTDIGCAEGVASAAYEICARALGQPGGSSTITTCATDLSTGEEVCSSENVILSRLKGKSTFTNVTSQLSTLCVDDPNTQNSCDTRVSLFADGFQDFFWSYYNRGLRLAQLRFYLLQ